MEATFFYDIKFLVKNNKIYSHYGANNSIFERYLNIFNKFTFVGRLEKVTKTNRSFIQNKYQVTNISLITYDNNYLNVQKVVKEAVKQSEFCICRLPSIAGAIAWYECEKQKKPYVIEVVGNAFEALWYHSFKGKFFAVPFHIIMKYVIKNSQFVAYITDSYLQKCYPTKGLSFHGIPNVSIPNIENEILDNRITRIKNRLIMDEVNIGLIGSFDVNYKGHDTAIKALKYLKDQYPNIKLHFLGQGETSRWEKAAAKAGVSSQLKFCGSLPGGTPVFNWLDTMDIYIQPSLTEGHGRATVEAMSRGCVTFASKTGGLVDSVDNKYLFTVRNFMELAKLIEKAINDKEYAIEGATNSFYGSKKYESDYVEGKRKKFYQLALQYWFK